MKILEYFKLRVINSPNNICLFSSNQSFTFKQLDEYSDEIATGIAEKTSKDIVPLYIDDDIFILPAVLGILKTGKIPLPLTTSLSMKQSAFRISDVDYDLIIANNQALMDDNLEIISISKDLGVLRRNYITDSINLVSNKETDIAYIICTSGSTGVPKKVFLSNENITWLLSEYYSLIEFSESSVFLFTTPYTFDVSLTEIFSPIFTGGKLCCFSRIQSSVEKMKITMKYVNKYRITHMSLPPTYAELLIDISEMNMFARLKYLCLAGEKLETQLAHKLSPIIKQGTHVLNLYGPSETTIYATYYELTGEEDTEIPIGQPINGCEFKIYDESGNIHSKGELYIGGKGVTLGYLLDKKQNEDKFIFINGKRFYKTGDYVHLNNLGELVFETRKDDQVKINGIRVELGEIENQVLNTPGIENCKTIFKDSKIIIFYISSSLNKNVENVLKSIIPQYLNVILIEVPEFLVNQNRKFDVKEMMERYYSKQTSSFGNKSTRDALEHILKKIGIFSYDNMDSIDTVRFFIEVEEEFHISISEYEMSSLVNIDLLVDFLENKERKTDSGDLVVVKDDSDEVNIVDEVNLRLLNEGFIQKNILNDRNIPTLFMQKQYAIKRYRTVISTDFYLHQFSFESVKEIENNLTKLSSMIDVLRMVIFEDNGSLYFKTIKNNQFTPIMYVSKRQIPEETIKKILFDKNGAQQFITIIYPLENKITVYFSHNIMDKSSLFKFSRLFNLLLSGNEIQTSNVSYEDYIDYIKKNNNKYSIDEIIHLIPETITHLPTLRTHIDKRVLLLKTQLSKKNALEVTIEAVFKVAQYLFTIDRNLTELTGSFVANIREFKGFDATDLIGDVHTTIPFRIEKNQTFTDFEYSVNKMVKVHEDGLNVRDKIFEGYPAFSGRYLEAKKKLESLNLSFNYIGEVSNLENTIKGIIKDKLPQKYIVVFTHKLELYIVICDDRMAPDGFKSGDYSNLDDIIIKDYVGE